MFDIFKTETLYVRVSRNNIELTHIESGRTVTRTANQDFSNDRMIIANFINFEALLRSLVTEIFGTRFFYPRIRMIIQQIDKSINKITPIEKRAYKDSAEQSGAQEVYFYDKQNRLTHNQVLELVKDKRNM